MRIDTRTITLFGNFSKSAQDGRHEVDFVTRAANAKAKRRTARGALMTNSLRLLASCNELVAVVPPFRVDGGRLDIGFSSCRQQFVQRRGTNAPVPGWLGCRVRPEARKARVIHRNCVRRSRERHWFRIRPRCDLDSIGQAARDLDVEHFERDVTPRATVDPGCFGDDWSRLRARRLDDKRVHRADTVGGADRGATRFRDFELDEFRAGHPRARVGSCRESGAGALREIVSSSVCGGGVGAVAPEPLQIGGTVTLAAHFTDERGVTFPDDVVPTDDRGAGDPRGSPHQSPRRACHLHSHGRCEPIRP